MTSTRRYFDRHARSLDRRYAQPTLLDRLLRAGPARGRDLAVSVVAGRPGASVLDVGCGPGRVGEAVLDADAGDYLGIDLSPAMLDLARVRLARFEQAHLREGDFRALDVPGRFDVVLALGLFEYLDEPEPAAAWLRERCAATLVASFTRRDRLKGPIRHAHYRRHGCRVVDYTEARAGAILAGAGFAGVQVVSGGRRGFLVTAAA
jgi:SAM-dependent methyltransferase